MEHTVSCSSAAIYISEKEFSELCTASDPEAPEIKALVGRILTENGQSPWPEMEIELFSGSGYFLILARKSGRHTYCFIFRDLDMLLEAAGACSGKLQSTLIYLDGSWLLFVRCDTDDVPWPFYEFGEELSCTDGYALHAYEQGCPLITDTAVDTLKKLFT